MAFQQHTCLQGLFIKAATGLTTNYALQNLTLCVLNSWDVNFAHNWIFYTVCKIILKQQQIFVFKSFLQ